MPTANRRPFIAAACQMFLRQTHAGSELVILDDGDDRISDCVPKNQRIRYYREEPGRRLGAKLNRCVELAQGDVILHWADDDYHAPWRIWHQLGVLERTGAEFTAPTDILRIDAKNRRAWHEKVDYLSGGAFAYRKAIWERHPYDDVQYGEDKRFVVGQVAKGTVVFKDPEYRFFVHRMHDTNSCMGKVYEVDPAAEVPFADVSAVIGQDWSQYFGGHDGLPRAIALTSV